MDVRYKNYQLLYEYSLASILLGISILFKFITQYLLLPVSIGSIGITGAPEIFLIPVGICFMTVNFKISTIMAMLASFSGYIMPGAGGQVAVNPYSFILDYTVPFLSMSLFAIYRYFYYFRWTKRFIYMSIIITIAGIIIFLGHWISGFLFYQFQLPKNFKVSLYVFSLIWNLPYTLLTYGIMLIIMNYFIFVANIKIKWIIRNKDNYEKTDMHTCS